jgi:hypothetical protein
MSEARARLNARVLSRASEHDLDIVANEGTAESGALLALPPTPHPRPHPHRHPTPTNCGPRKINKNKQNYKRARALPFPLLPLKDSLAHSLT